jgi:hypothetical protein
VTVLQRLGRRLPLAILIRNVLLFGYPPVALTVGRNMAKKKSTKASAIREELARSPKASAKEIQATLGTRGIKVHVNHIYLIKHATKRKARKAKRAASRQNGHTSPVELVLDVRKLAEQAGGIAQLKALVDVLAE